MRVGYFGGSFDPPHRAHLRVALLAQKRFALEQVLLAPTGRQPLKSGGAEAPFADRLHMVELLCAGHSGLQASALDGPRPQNEPNYTIDTLRRLSQDLAAGQPGSAPTLFAIVGADAFLGLRQWREPEALLRLAQWIVVSRPGFAFPDAQLGLTPAQSAAVHLLPGLAEAVSATDLRQRLHKGLPCEDLIPAPVLHYLQARELYR